MTVKPETTSASPTAADGENRPVLTDAARRALAEAEARRVTAKTGAAGMAPEIGGRGGLDPSRYGDWEVKGLASDF